MACSLVSFRVAPVLVVIRLCVTCSMHVTYAKRAYTVNTAAVGIHALINVHEYHCIAIRMRCWLMDD
jgi:hypothetical protein